MRSWMVVVGYDVYVLNVFSRCSVVANRNILISARKSLPYRRYFYAANVTCKVGNIQVNR